MGPLQVACVPNGVARQDFSNRLEYHAIAGVAADVLLAVNAAVILADRRMTHPPPPGRDHASGHGMLHDEWFVWIGHRQNPSILLPVLRQSTDRLK